MLLELLRYAHFRSNLTFSAIAVSAEVQLSHVSEFMRGLGPYPRWKMVQALAVQLLPYLHEVSESDLLQLWLDGLREAPEKKKGIRWIEGCLKEGAVSISGQIIVVALFILVGLQCFGLLDGIFLDRSPSSASRVDHRAENSGDLEAYKVPSPIAGTQPQVVAQVVSRAMVYRVPRSAFQESKGVQIFELYATRKITFECKSRNFSSHVYLKVSGSKVDYVSTRALQKSMARESLGLPNCPQSASPRDDVQ
ncbi:hypothetical protein [Streptomyces sp. SAI-117]|uniref:hypothetical protein n=1 Tax=Streptomyces sp. SAI-117 TaxID=2940546 RepID=UPI002476A333|nr:hypothetical protein [Streptomyces sp. SAI-117]